MGYDTSWLSSDQIPRRALEDGRVDRFGHLDDGPRGSTRRLSLSFNAHRTRSGHTDRVSAYAVANRFALVSNFTYFLDDQERGDQFQQGDERLILGGSWERVWFEELGGHPFEGSVDGDLRFDEISNALEKTTQLTVSDVVRRDDVNQLGGGLFARGSWRPADWLTIDGSLRFDGFHASVDSQRALNSGTRSDVQLSPKLSLVFSPFVNTRFSVKLGRGLHSNDARGAALSVDPVTGEPAAAADPLVASRGIDLGLDTRVGRKLDLSLALFRIDLDSELVFVGDAGNTEALGSSTREGVEVTADLRLGRGFHVELDATLADARLDTSSHGRAQLVPGAVGTSLGAGIVRDASVWSGALRLRHFGDIPLTPDGDVTWEGSTTVDGVISFPIPALPRLTVTVEVFNLLDSRASDVEYFYASRLPGEPVGGIEDIHLKPLRPRSARLTLRWSPGSGS